MMLLMMMMAGNDEVQYTTIWLVLLAGCIHT